MKNIIFIIPLSFQDEYQPYNLKNYLYFLFICHCTFSISHITLLSFIIHFFLSTLSLQFFDLLLILFSLNFLSLVSLSLYFLNLLFSLSSCADYSLLTTFYSTFSLYFLSIFFLQFFTLFLSFYQLSLHFLTFSVSLSILKMSWENGRAKLDEKEKRKSNAEKWGWK